MRLKTIAGFLPALFLFFASSCVRETNDLLVATAETDQQTGRASTVALQNDTVIVGIARINILRDGSTEYLFNERQSPYIVDAEDPDAVAIRRLADAALADKKPLRLLSPAPGIIAKLESPSALELRRWTELRNYDLKDIEPERRFNFTGYDTLQFNTASWQNWQVFARCKKIIPDLATAKAIFTFCRQQTCTYGPTQIQPCIPFKYVKDGCFARAHKMRYIIEQRYGYCSEKVFNYGNLDVKANLAGGCCINWWYHVAPVVRVKVNGLTLLYVIDPSMFTEPVPLLEWIFAQENTTCDAGSNVMEYSIQPSSAYHPIGYMPVSAYATDPNYAETNSSLLFYAGEGPSCPNP